MYVYVLINFPLGLYHIVVKMNVCMYLFLVLAVPSCDGFSFATSRALPTSKLYNVPAKGYNDADSASIKDSANREPPPQSFYQLGLNSVRAAELAIADGNKLIEIEVCMKIKIIGLI